MGKMTLTQLIAATGVDQLTPNGTEKIAAPEFSFAKLAERCRKAADESPVSIDEQGLGEKTASVAVIARVLKEIRDLERLPHTKEAAATNKEAVFIQRALAEGHTPDAIAGFLRSFAA